MQKLLMVVAVAARELRQALVRNVSRVVETQATWSADGVQWHRLLLDARIPVIMARPNGASKVVLLAHATGGSMHDFRAKMAWYAARGAATAAFDGPYHGARSGVESYERASRSERTRKYIDRLIEVWRGADERPFVLDGAADALRVVDYLSDEGLEVGATGVSLGGMVVWLAAAADDRISVVAPMIGVQWFDWAAKNDAWRARADSLRRLFETAANDLGKPLDADVFARVLDAVAPGLRGGIFDAPASLPLIAPRPLLIVNAELDPRCPLHGVAPVYVDLVDRYVRLGHASNLALYIDPGVEHKPTDAMWNVIDAWFDTHLFRNNTLGSLPPDTAPVFRSPAADHRQEARTYLRRFGLLRGEEECPESY